MKLRQKLALALATAMVVTAVPVTTMAASTNTWNKTLAIVKGDVITTEDNLGLHINFDSASYGVDTTFFVSASHFSFTDVYGDITKTVNGEEVVIATVTRLSATELKVESTGEDFILPMHGTVTDVTPTITIDGRDSTVSSGKYYLAGSGENVAAKGVTLTVGDAKSASINGNGTISDITLNEIAPGLLNNTWIKLELDRYSDLVFTGDLDDITVSGTRGHAGIDKSVIKEIKTVEDELYILLGDLNEDEFGTIKITGISVEGETRRDVPVGEVEATISSVKKDGDNWVAASIFDTVTQVVTKVVEYGVTLTVKDNTPVEVTAGGANADITVALNELAAGSLDRRDNVYFTVEGADIIGESFEDKAVDAGLLSYDADDQEFTLEFTDANKDSARVFSFVIKVGVEAGSTDDIVLVAESKDFDDDMETVIGTVVDDRHIETETANLVIGKKGQVAGSITISETEAETFKRDGILYVQLEEDADDDHVSIEDFDVTVTEDSGLEVEKHTEVYYSTTDGLTLTKGDNEVAKNVIAVEVTRESDEAATITINNIEFDTNNATPEASYSLILSGDVAATYGVVEVEDFVVVGEEVEEVVEEVVVSNEVVLVPNSTTGTTINGVPVDAAAAYVEGGRTMIPTRFVAEAFGAQVDFGTLNGVGTITIFKDGDIVQFQNGSSIMTVNGTEVPMDAVTVIKDGTSYVPFRFLANALEVTFTLAADGTITFKN